MSNTGNDPKSSEAYRGGTLAELSARGGTSIPADAGTQNVVHSAAREKRFKTDSRLVGPAADNTTDLPDNPRASGRTGEVTTMMGDQLPPGVEDKHLGETYGGKELGAGRHTLKATRGIDVGATGPGHVDSK